MSSDQQIKTNEFENKVAFITGGSGGIGQAAALAFAKRGAKVVIADVTASNDTTKSMVESLGGEALLLETDVSNEESMKSAIEATVKQFGRLDFAFNNAGIRNVSKIIDLEVDSWQKIIDVNLTGVFLGMKYQLPEILKTKGAIVNTASIWGMTGAVDRSAYVASKAGVIGLTKTAATEYGEQGVRVNAIAPGLIKTAAAEKTLGEGIGVNAVVQHTPMQRPGEPMEIGEVVAWLCSEQASFVNGAILPVDGGWSAH